MTVLTLSEDARQEATAVTVLCYLPPTQPERAAAVASRLARAGLHVVYATDVTDALRRLTDDHWHPAVCIVDLADERMAVPAVRTLRAHHADLAVIGVMDPTRPLVAAEAVQAGVADLLPWPFDEQDVMAVVANARDHASPPAAQPDASVSLAGEVLFAHSPAMRQVVDLVRAAAGRPGGVLIVGEAGSGREMIARALHAHGPRAKEPFVAVDCSNTLSAESLERSIFGVASERVAPGTKVRTIERIARTGAFHAARGGMLYLVNVHEAAARVQARLARILRDGEATLVDKRTVVDLDLRCVAAVDAGVDAAVADGRLRRDLYERLAVTKVEVPALRRRREDIPLLAIHVLGQVAAGEPGFGVQRFSRSALALLAALPWPGNGHELRALIKTLRGTVTRPVIELEDVLSEVRLDGMSPRLDLGGSLRDARIRFERDWISAVLVKHQGRVGDAARALGIQRTNLYRKVRQLQVARALIGRKA